MTKVKICGLRRPEDIRIVNLCKPDYAGFIIHFPQSYRSLTVSQVERLTSMLDPGIQSVGVFVDEDPQLIIDLLKRDILDLTQLHGRESEDRIRHIQKESGKQVIKAFEIHTMSDIEQACMSPADYILLDKGKGSGQTFDWSLIRKVDRPFFLAGGLQPDNIDQAIQMLHPFAVDISSGVETQKYKDYDKIETIMKKIRKENL